MVTGAAGAGKAQRLLKRPLRRLSFVRCFPLAIDRSKPARIKKLLRLRVANFEQILAEIRRIDRLLRIAGPGKRLNHHAVDAEHFLRRIAGVVVIEPHRRRCGKCRETGKEKDSQDKDWFAHSRIIQRKTDSCHPRESV